MKALILVLDSFGVGYTADADKFGDKGSDTLGSIANYCQQNGIDFKLPNLDSLGLAKLHHGSTGKQYSKLNVEPVAGAGFGYAEELSSGKDTPSGHWEMAGTPVLFDWGYFERKPNCFPQELIDKLIEKTGVSGILGNCHASGTEIIKRLGEEHVKTGMPICYTSADSVFQVAAHEEHFGLDELYKFCEAARELTYELNIGRVIARPFDGVDAEDFARTNNRRDYAIEPPEETVLDKLVAAGGDVVSIGKIADIFAHKGITKAVKAYGIDGLFDASVEVYQQATDNTLIFTNFVDFDQNFGHRRDPEGYAKALMHFDARLPELLEQLSEDDLLILTADHGCDPCWEGTEHTREHVPVMTFCKANKQAVDLSLRKSFADIGQSLADYFQLSPMQHGQSFLTELGIK